MNKFYDRSIFNLRTLAFFWGIIEQGDDVCFDIRKLPKEMTPSQKGRMQCVRNVFYCLATEGYLNRVSYNTYQISDKGWALYKQYYQKYLQHLPKVKGNNKCHPKDQQTH